MSTYVYYFFSFMEIKYKVESINSVLFIMGSAIDFQLFNGQNEHVAYYERDSSPFLLPKCEPSLLLLFSFFLFI